MKDYSTLRTAHNITQQVLNSAIQEAEEELNQFTFRLEGAFKDTD
jgi:hypothetical protein